jgi:hypothetical protein
MNRLGNILNRLIAERAYATGRLQAIEQELDTLRLKIDALSGEQSKLTATVAYSDQRIQELSLIDVNDIRAVRLNARHSTTPYGGVMRDIINFFQSRSGQGVGTDELAAYLSRTHYSLTTPPGVLTKRVSHVCFVLSRHGVIERLESRRSEKSNQMRAVWRWVGNSAMNSTPQFAAALAGQAGNAEVIDLPTIPLAAVVCPVD